MTADAQQESGAAGAIDCPPRTQLAIAFVVIAFLLVLGAFKVLIDLVSLDEPQYAHAISGFLVIIGLGVGAVFAALACRGLKVSDEGIVRLEVIGSPKTYAWDKVKALVFCMPRSPDAVETFWFEVEDGKKVGVPLKCSYEAARLALKRGTELKIMSFYQLAGNDFLEGDAYKKAEEHLKKRLEEKEKGASDGAQPQPAAG